MNKGDKLPVYHPPWARDGCVVQREWTYPVVSGRMVGTKHMVMYKNAKGKEITTMKWVIWDE